MHSDRSPFRFDVLPQCGIVQFERTIRGSQNKNAILTVGLNLRKSSVVSACFVRMLGTYAIELDKELGLQSAHGIMFAFFAFCEQGIDFV